MLTFEEIDQIAPVVKRMRNGMGFREDPKISHLAINTLRSNAILFQHAEHFEVVTTYNSDRHDFYLTIVKSGFRHSRGRYISIESNLFLVAFKMLKQDMGLILIRPETLEDRLNELFNRKELDLEQHPVFSKKYYFLASDKNKALGWARPPIVEAIGAMDQLSLEVNGNYVLATFGNRICAAHADQLVKLMSLVKA